MRVTVFSILLFLSLSAPSQAENKASAIPIVSTVEREFVEIKLTETKSSDIAKAYPFLKAEVEKIVDPEWETPFPPQALVAEMRNVAKDASLLFLYFRDGQSCKGEVCGLTIYMDTGGGYKDSALSIFSPLPFYFVKGGKTPSLMICTNLGREEWALENHRSSFKGLFEEKGVPPCGFQTSPQPK